VEVDNGIVVSWEEDNGQKTEDKGGNLGLLTRRMFRATQWFGIGAGKDRESIAASAAEATRASLLHWVMCDSEEKG